MESNWRFLWRLYVSQPLFAAADRCLDAVIDRRGGVRHWPYAVTGDSGSGQARRSMEPPGLAHGSLQGSRRVAQAVAGHSSFTRRMDLGIRWRRLRGKPRPNLGRHARRAAVAEGRRSVDALCGAQSVARERHGQLGRVESNVPAGEQAGMGAPLPALDHRVRSPGQPRGQGRTSTSCSPSFPAVGGRTRSRSAPTTKKSTYGSSTTSST